MVETVREKDDLDFTHHSQTLETGTTKVLSKNVTLFSDSRKVVSVVDNMLMIVVTL